VLSVVYAKPAVNLGHTEGARELVYESFYLGPSLYVAPVLDPQTFEIKVYFPGSSNDSKYVHVWTGTKYSSGEEAMVPTPYGQPAVFVVEGKEMPELQSFLDFVKRENATKLMIE
jgi:alpha-glucosidase (family GH31 glycosyl hydrolase)